MKYNFSYFKNILENSSILNYKYVYIYCDLRFFLSQNINDKNFVDKLINFFIKNNQTIIVPSFSYSKDIFDVKTTKSKVGFLSNYILKQTNFERSEHPLFSYISIGPNKKIVRNIGKSAFGNDSVHARLLFKNACFLHIGREIKFGNTLIHHVEQNLNASYRFDKKFKTKVFKKQKYLGTAFKAYVRKETNKNYFTFTKILKKKNFLDIINRLNNEKNFKSIFYYSYDSFYFFLHEEFLKNKDLFIKKL